MNRFYNFVLFFLFDLTFSSLGMEEVVTISAQASNLKDVAKILVLNDVNIDDSAIFLDFDETTVRTIATYKGQEFIFLDCPDRNRTYKNVYAQAFQNSGFVLDEFDITDLLDEENVEVTYKILDLDMKNFVGDVSNAGFLGVCSAIDKNDQKEDVLKDVGIYVENYIYANNGKINAICEKLQILKQNNKKITSVVLLDNSKRFVIDHFIKDMPNRVAELGLTGLKIIGIEFTKYAEMLSQEAITDELTRLKTLHKGAEQPSTVNSQNSQEFYDNSFNYEGSSLESDES